MGKRGPAAKGRELRLIEGTDRKGRSGRLLDVSRMPVAPDGDMDPLHELTEEGREIWDQAVADLESMGVASPVDRLEIHALVGAVERWRRATRQLVAEPLVVVGARGGVLVNPVVQVQRDAAAEITRICDRFGLSPAARMSVETNPVAAGSRGSRDAGKKPNPFDGRPLDR
jgi:P27 family predicted phage terminase small subunit